MGTGSAEDGRRRVLAEGQRAALAEQVPPEQTWSQ